MHRSRLILVAIMLASACAPAGGDASSAVRDAGPVADGGMSAAWVDDSAVVDAARSLTANTTAANLEAANGPAGSGSTAGRGASVRRSPVSGPDTTSCEQHIAALHLSPATARQRRYASRSVEVLVHGAVTPLLYLSWPDPSGRERTAAATRARIEESPQTMRELRRVLERHEGDAAFLREVLLTEGYLFAERPGLARSIQVHVRLEHLFDAPRVYRARDGVIDALEQTEGRYLEPGGAPARARLNDRYALDPAELAPPLALELEVVREITAAQRVVPVAQGREAAEVRLTFPDGSSRPALLAIEEGQTVVRCVGGDPASLPAALADASAFRARHSGIVAAARALVAERLRFDEPVNEPDGVQEDGQLRIAWSRAYRQGERTFTYREVSYPVFDRAGRPVPPEVCVDFVFDAWARGTGTWYRGEGAAPGRTVGAVDLAPVPVLARRSVPALLGYAEEEGAVLERFDVPTRRRVPLAEGRRFARAVGQLADDVREGDALVIHGLREQDMRLHAHLILIVRTDPVTGVPMVVADNQGRAHLRSLAGAMRAAPLRSIKHRLRPVFQPRAERLPSH